MLACLSILAFFTPLFFSSFLFFFFFLTLLLIYVPQEIAERSFNGRFYFRWVGAVDMGGAGAILVHFHSMVL